MSRLGVLWGVKSLLCGEVFTKSGLCAPEVPGGLGLNWINCGFGQPSALARFHGTHQQSPQVCNTRGVGTFQHRPPLPHGRKTVCFLSPSSRSASLAVPPLFASAVTVKVKLIYEDTSFLLGFICPLLSFPWGLVTDSGCVSVMWSPGWDRGTYLSSSSIFLNSALISNMQHVPGLESNISDNCKVNLSDKCGRLRVKSKFGVKSKYNWTHEVKFSQHFDLI